MAVERLTDYTRRIWTGLSADAPDPDMQVGDVIYYMDTSTCSIITGIPAPGSIDAEDLPDVGGGGGAGINLRLLGSGTYTQLSNSTRSVLIPTELEQHITKILFTVESVDKTAMSNSRMTAWWRMYHVEDYFDPEVFPGPSEVLYITSADVKQWKARTSNNTKYAIKATVDPGIEIAPVGAGDTIYAGEYIWKVWGV